MILSTTEHSSRMRTLVACVLITTVGVRAEDRRWAELRLDGAPPSVATNWTWSKDIERAELTRTGLWVRIRGPDPYLVGPIVPFESPAPLWLEVIWHVSSPGWFQVFWGERGFHETQSERGQILQTGLVHSWVQLPNWTRQTRIRLDPPGATGEVVVTALRWWPRRTPALPTWSSQRTIGPTGASDRVQSGPLTVAADPTGWSVQVQRVPMGMADDDVWIGYTLNDTDRWFRVADCVVSASVSATQAAIERTVRARDPDGATWSFLTSARPGPSGVVEIGFTVQCDQDRSVIALPVWLLRVGSGTFGGRKRQGLFCGLEYLDDEPSSSEADVVGRAAIRRAPASYKVTIPLMGVAATSRVVGLSWAPQEGLQPWFDSPDRQLGGGAHVLGWFARPPSGRSLDEGSYWNDPPWILRANVPARWSGEILGTEGETMVPLVALYVATHGLPPPPPHPYTRESYARVAAIGWMETPIRDGDQFRHAWTPHDHWKPQLAADASVHLWWLAAVLQDEPLRAQAIELAERSYQAVPAAQRWHAKIGAGRWIAPALMGRDVLRSVATARTAARHELARISPEGIVPYQPTPGGTDFSTTHAARHASGYSGAVAERALRAALFSGDPDVCREALERATAVRRRYRGDIPRGAQTWEIPLHTPDILAAAHMVELCVQGYEVTRDVEWLEDAQYWAWTGVPFVYLVPPTRGPIGLYAPIPVYGATHWTAPVWFGLPVHWCGLVYAEALYNLSRYDSTGPWRKIANGIVASSLQAMWPPEDPQRAGLLPDFVVLQSQERGGPAINPAVLAQCTVHYFLGPEVHRTVCLPPSSWIVRAAGAVEVTSKQPKRAELRLTPLVAGRSRAYISGLAPTDRVIWNGRQVRELPDTEWDSTLGQLAWPLDSAGVLVLERQ